MALGAGVRRTQRRYRAPGALLWCEWHAQTAKVSPWPSA